MFSCNKHGEKKVDQKESCQNILTSGYVRENLNKQTNTLVSNIAGIIDNKYNLDVAIVFDPNLKKLKSFRNIKYIDPKRAEGYLKCNNDKYQSKKYLILYKHYNYGNTVMYCGYGLKCLKNGEYINVYIGCNKEYISISELKAICPMNYFSFLIEYFPCFSMNGFCCGNYNLVDKQPKLKKYFHKEQITIERDRMHLIICTFEKQINDLIDRGNKFILVYKKLKEDFSDHDIKIIYFNKIKTDNSDCAWVTLNESGSIELITSKDILGIFRENCLRSCIEDKNLIEYLENSKDCLQDNDYCIIL